MVTDPPFRETRREPSDRRAWRQTPVFAGDAAVFVGDPSRIVIVTGVLPRGCLEVVPLERAKRAVGDLRSLDALQDALADRRVIPRAARRRDLAPATEAHAEAVDSGGNDNGSGVSAT